MLIFTHQVTELNIIKEKSNNNQVCNINTFDSSNAIKKVLSVKDLTRMITEYIL